MPSTGGPDGGRPGRRDHGGSSGIGRATALACARRGDRLVLAARSPDSLRSAEQECRAAGAQTLVLTTDVADQAAVDALLAAAVARAVLRCLDRPRRDLSVGPANPIAVLGFRTLPGLFDLLVTPLMNLGGLARSRTGRHDGNVFEPQPAGDKIHGGWRRRGLRRGNVGAGGHHDPG